MTRRIVILGQLPPPTHGSARMTQLLAGALEEAGVQSHTVSRDLSETVSEIGTINLRKLLRLPRLVGQWMKALLGRPPGTVIVFGSTRTPIAYLDAAFLLMARLTNWRTINYVHARGYTQLSHSGLAKFTLKQQLQKVDTIVLLGPSLSADVKPFSGQPIVLIPNCSMTPAPTSHEAIDRPIDAIFYSNLIASKGIVDFLKVAEIVSNNRESPPCFRICGAPTHPDEQREIEKNIAALQRAGCDIAYLGAVTLDSKFWPLSASKLLAFPSTYSLEAQPLSIIESMAAGCVPIAYPTGGIPDLIEHGQSGILCGQFSPDEMAHHVMSLLEDLATLETMSAEARRAHQENHSMEAYQRAWLDLLRQ